MRYPGAVANAIFQRARTAENKRLRAEALMEAARLLALEAGVASVTLTAVADRAGVHHSAIRRYFTSHKEVLLHLAAEGWTRWAANVSKGLRVPGPMSPGRAAETLADGLAADPLFCDLLANVPLHLEHEVSIDRVVDFKRISLAAFISIADSIEHALPELGRRGALDTVTAAYALAATLWQVAHPPEALAGAYADGRAVPPDWNLEFVRALTRLLTATCVGLASGGPHGSAQRPTTT
ncbi:MAG TPA: TetR family transcriptional regulator [Mycobacterium sp.]|nr:TetR family transcriptional regulator [Mycobacterium sp.]